MEKKRIVKIAGIALVALLAATVAYYVGTSRIRSHTGYQPLRAGETPWFENLADSPDTLDVEDAHKLLSVVRANIKNPTAPLPALSQKLDSDDKPRVLFLSVSDGKGRAKVAIGGGRGIKEALADSIKKSAKALPKDYDAEWVKLDIVQTVAAADRIGGDWRIHNASLDRELQGIAFERDISTALLPDELTSLNLVNKKGVINLQAISNYVKRSHNNSKASKALSEIVGKTKDGKKVEFFVRRFTTTSFFNNGTKTERLYRGHAIFKELTNDDLKESLKAGADYLVRSTREDGSIVYEYKVKQNKEGKGYNFLRHGGTVYSMIDTYRYTKDEKLLIAAKRALDYLAGYMKPFMGRDDAYCLAANRSVKLGGAGLALIAMAQYYHATGDNQYVPMMQKLATYIGLEQSEDGQFVHKRKYPSFEKTNFTSNYYPGEAMFGLGALYEIDKNEKWLDISEKSAEYLINIRDKGKSVDKLYHDHWLLLALDILYRHRKKELYLEHAMKIAEGIMMKQHIEPPFPDWIGGYYRPPGSTPTATRGEGLNAAFRLARDFGKTEYKDKLIKALHLNMHFQLACQFQPANSMHIPDPQRSMGGFKASLQDFSIRNDYVQHNISAIVNYLRILEEENIRLDDPKLESVKLLNKSWQFDTVFPKR